MKVHEFTLHCGHEGCGARHVYEVKTPVGIGPDEADYCARMEALNHHGWSQTDERLPADEVGLRCPAHTTLKGRIVVEMTGGGVEHLASRMDLTRGSGTSHLPIAPSDTATARSFRGRRLRVTIEVIE